MRFHAGLAASVLFGAFGMADVVGQPTKTAQQPLEVVGFVVPAQTVHVSTVVSGRVVELFFEEGKAVKKGQPLLRLDDTPYAATLRLAEALVKKAEANLIALKKGAGKEELNEAALAVREAEAMMKAADERFARAAELLKQKVLSPGEYDLARQQAELARIKVDQAKAREAILKRGPREEELAVAMAELAAAEAQRRRAEFELDATTIRAPIDGTVLQKVVEVGDVTASGSGICTIADLGRLEVAADVFESDLARVRIGQACRVRVAAFAGQEFQGTVTRIFPVADRSRGAVPVRVRLELPANNVPRLLPEMRAQVRFVEAK